jgi:High potential iron-sulfur protein
MTDQPGATKDGVCRRSLLKSMPMIAGAIISATAIPGSLFAQTKVSHEASKYQDQPKNGQQCSNCALFEPPSSCKVVESPISPNAWCQLWAAKPA